MSGALRIGEQIAQPVARTLALIISEHVVGEVHDNGDNSRTGSRFHVVIDARRVTYGTDAYRANDPLNHGSPLIQGHGATADEALVNAVQQTRAFVAAFSAAVEALAEASAKRIPGENT